jgi:peptidoglycan hydrolase-like protein with peptidoglycan-binding domain
MIVGSGPLAPSSHGLGMGYIPPRPQIDYPNGHIVYLDETSSASTTPQLSAATASTAPFPLATPSLSLSFPQNRQLWDEGPDILVLQQFLNTHGFPLVSSGGGSPGDETSTFGLHTYAALVKFQFANNLSATGFFGPLTREMLSATSTPQ